MARIDCFNPIAGRISNLPAGEIFVISDFSDLADDAAIRKVLSRLEGDGKSVVSCEAFTIAPYIMTF